MHTLRTQAAALGSTVAIILPQLLCTPTPHNVYLHDLMDYRYRFDVKKDGTWENRKTFAYVAAGIPDGKMRNHSIYI